MTRVTGSISGSACISLYAKEILYKELFLIRNAVVMFTKQDTNNTVLETAIVITKYPGSHVKVPAKTVCDTSNLFFNFTLNSYSVVSSK